MAQVKLILGSASPFRKKLLEDAGFAFEVRTADIDEKAIRTDDFKELVLKLALAKRDAILAKNDFAPDTILITSDFVASHNGKLREKPISKEEVLAWHKEYSGGKTVCYCSLVVHHVGAAKTLQAVDTAEIEWGFIPPSAIQKIADDPLTYKAAAFTNRSFFHYMKNLHGSIDTVIGLPIRILEEFLEELEYFE